MKIRMTGRGGRGVGGALARVFLLAVQVFLLAVLAVCFAQLLRLCVPGCRTDALLRARERAALEWNVRRGVYPAGDWDAAEFSVGSGSGQ